MATAWDFSAKIVPLVVGGVGITVCAAEPVQRHVPEAGSCSVRKPGGCGQHEVEQKIHMDLASDTEHLPVSIIVKRAAAVLRLPDRLHGGHVRHRPRARLSALFVVIFMRYENKEPWKLVISYAIVLVFAISFVFDNVMSIPWPPTLIAQWFPALKFLPSI